VNLSPRRRAQCPGRGGGIYAGALRHVPERH